MTLARLAPLPGETLWDIGAGCGSIAIEWLRAVPGGAAIAIERDPGACRDDRAQRRRARRARAAHRRRAGAAGARRSAAARRRLRRRRHRRSRCCCRRCGRRCGPAAGSSPMSSASRASARCSIGRRGMAASSDPHRGQPLPRPLGGASCLAAAAAGNTAFRGKTGLTDEIGSFYTGSASGRAIPSC